MDIKLRPKWANDPDAQAIRNLFNFCFSGSYKARAAINVIYNLCNGDNTIIDMQHICLGTEDRDFNNIISAMKLIRGTKLKAYEFFENEDDLLAEMTTIFTKTEADIAYRQLAHRSVRYERLVWVKAHKQILDAEIRLIEQATLRLNVLDSYDANKLKQYIEIEMIHNYSSETKVAKCFTCDIWYSCPKILAQGNEPEAIYKKDADKECPSYVQQSFVGSLDAAMLHPLLDILAEKYRIDRERVLSNI
jgi:hypothetical protein